jgi:PAS domain S-box-containing protein
MEKKEETSGTAHKAEVEGAEDFYRVIVETMTEGVITLTGDGKIGYANRTFAAMLNMPRDQVIGSAMDRLVHAADLPKYETLRAGNSKGEIRLQTGDGSILPACFSVGRLEGTSAALLCAIVTDLTEQKRNYELRVAAELAQTKWAEAESARQRIGKILESVTDGFFTLDREWRITDVSLRAADIYTTHEDLIGQVFWSVFPQNKMTEFDYQYHKAMEERIPVHFEARSRVAENRWFDLHIYPTEEGLSIYFRDITARKETEEKLRRSEAYLAEGQRLSHTASWAWNPVSGEFYWSAELFRIYGLDPDKTKPSYPEVLSYIHPDDRSRSQKTFEEAVREQKEYELAYRVMRSDGTIRHVNDLAHPVSNEVGVLVEYVGTAIDTTERILAEEELLRSEAHLAEAQRIGQVGSWVWNVATGECLWSREHFRIFGLDPDTFRPTKENTQRLIHPEDLPFVERTLERAIREQSNFEVDYRLIRPDGAIRYHHGIGRPVAKPQGDPEFIGMVVDVTERREAEEALQKLQTEFTHLTRVTAMGELAASIAHEINQPLGAIVNNSKVCLRLLRRLRAQKQVRDALADIVKDANRSSAIIARIRSLTKPSAPEKTSLQPQHLVTDVLALARLEIEARRIIIQIDLAPDPPPISGDRVQLQQVLLNLMRNACDAMSDVSYDQRILTISCRHAELKGNPAVMLSVQDRGCGFSVEDAKRLFEAFYTTKPHGMGMGLRISLSIAEAHGGKLTASLNSGAPGATFSLLLPAVLGAKTV